MQDLRSLHRSMWYVCRTLCCHGDICEFEVCLQTFHGCFDLQCEMFLFYVFYVCM